MDRKYFYDKHRQNEISKLEDDDRRKQNTELFLRRNPSNNYNKIPDMKSAYEKVLEKDHITIDQDYMKITGNLKYKL